MRVLHTSLSIRPSIGLEFVQLASILLAILFAKPSHASAPLTLSKVSLASGSVGAYIDLQFSTKAQADQPKFFQRYSASESLCSICMLNTETSLPLGKQAVMGMTWAEALSLDKWKSAQGNRFLCVKLKGKFTTPKDNLPVTLTKAGTLRFNLGKEFKLTQSWSTSQEKSEPLLKNPSTVSKSKPKAEVIQKEDRLGTNMLETKKPSNPVEKNPASVSMETKNEALQKPVSKSTTEIAKAGALTAPSPKPPIETASVVKTQEKETPSQKVPVLENATVTELHLLSSNGHDELLLKTDSKSSPSFSVEKKGDLSFEIHLPGYRFSEKTKNFTLPEKVLFKEVSFLANKSGLLVKIDLRSGNPVQIIPNSGTLRLAAPALQGNTESITWSSIDGKQRRIISQSEIVESAHDIGAKIESEGKTPSSKSTFTPGSGGKPVWITRESIFLRSGPGTQFKQAAQVMKGMRLLKVGNQKEWYALLQGRDTLYARQDMVVFEDQLSTDELSKLKKLASEREMEAIRQKDILADKQKPGGDAQVEQSDQSPFKPPAQTQVVEKPIEKKVEKPAPLEKPVPVKKPDPAILEAQEKAVLAAKKEEEKRLRDVLEEEKRKLAEQQELNRNLEEQKKAEEERQRKLREARNRVVYNSFGRRDPFEPVEYGASGMGIDIDQMRLVGVVWDEREPLGVMEHVKEKGLSYTIKEGDPVINGRVSRITKDRVTFDITEYGISRTFSLRLVPQSEREGK